MSASGGPHSRPAGASRSNKRQAEKPAQTEAAPPPLSSGSSTRLDTDEAVADVEPRAPRTSELRTKKKKGNAAGTSKPRAKARAEAISPVPPFAADFPADAELAQLLLAFRAGNYAWVREHAPKLVARTKNRDVAAAARELRRRIDPDPLAVYLIAVSTGLLAFVTFWLYLHRH